MQRPVHHELELEYRISRSKEERQRAKPNGARGTAIKRERERRTTKRVKPTGKRDEEGSILSLPVSWPWLYVCSSGNSRTNQLPHPTNAAF